MSWLVVYEHAWRKGTRQTASDLQVSMRDRHGYVLRLSHGIAAVPMRFRQHAGTGLPCIECVSDARGSESAHPGTEPASARAEACRRPCCIAGLAWGGRR